MILVTGAGGFIAGHLIKRLLDDEHDVIGADIKSLDKWHQAHDKAINVPLADLNEQSVVRNIFKGFPEIDEVFSLACNMGGMGFIENFPLECGLSVQMSTNTLRTAVENGVKRYFYSSSACVYNTDLQRSCDNVALKEDDVFPAYPNEIYGWEKLYGELLAQTFMKETGMEVHISRYHNIYGPKGSWNDGREKVPAAICRKIAEAVVYGLDHIDIWGDGNQMRSFCWIDDCIDGTLKLMNSDYYNPLNIGSDRCISVNGLVDIVESVAGVNLERRYQLDAPKGVGVRNSDNTLVKEVLNWEPKVSLEDGLRELYNWILPQVYENKALGIGPMKVDF